MRILLLGGSGQLGWEIRQRAFDLNFDLHSPVKSEVNISDAEQVKFLAKELKPEVIVNCAAYTAVDKAESEPERAFLINRDGAINAAEAANQVNARLIYISTDYVFDGSAQAPINEQTETNPINVYGASKLAGEKAIVELCGQRALILRTSWLHGKQGQNFVQTMLKLFNEREQVDVVNDQFGNPTWAGWLAEVILDLARIDTHGVLHAACSGKTTWFDFAQEILNLAKVGQESSANIHRVKLQAMSSDQLQRAAKRPMYSVLDCSKLEQILGRACLDWKDGLRAHLYDLGLLKQI